MKNYYNSGKSVLAKCIKDGDNKTLKKRLRRGVDPNSTVSKSGRMTVLELAYSQRNGQALVHLIEAGANLDVRLCDGLTLIHYSVHNRKIDHLRYFIENGANPCLLVDESPNSRYSGMAALHIAAKAGCANIVEYLLSWVDVNARDSYGNTALHSALYSENIYIQDKNGVVSVSCNVPDEGVVRCLIEYGCDESLANKDGYVPSQVSNTDEGSTFLSKAVAERQAKKITAALVESEVLKAPAEQKRRSKI